MTQQILYREFTLAGNAQQFLLINEIINKNKFPQSQFSSSDLKIHNYPFKPTSHSLSYLNGTLPPDRGNAK